MLKRLVRTVLSGGLMLLLATSAGAQTPKELNVFVYGNSLIHHETDADDTNVPFWLSQMAVAGGHSLALDGQWGFLPQLATNLPPEPQWQFDGVDRVWTNDGFAFRRVPFDTILISPANFVQYQGADEPYDGDNPSGDSPFAATGRIIDWTHTNARAARFFIYEGWAEMAGIVDYPPDANDLVAYFQANQDDYHQWYVDYVAALQASRPEVDITLIPVASILSDVMINTPLSGIPAEELFSDDAPHGTANFYFLASMVTYAALYADAPPDMALPESLHPLIRENYNAVSDRIWAQFTGAVIPESAAASGQSRPVTTGGTGLADPSLALGLNGIADWSTQQPFINVMKSARPWIGHLPGQWGGWEMPDLIDGGYLDENGWPLAIPDGVAAIEAFVLTDQPPGATSLAGRYVVTWDGQGAISVGGNARDVERVGDSLVFDYRPEEGLVSIRIEDVDADDPIRNIAVVREDMVPLHEAGVIFNPDWIAKIRDVRMIRFMDWMLTNGSPQVNWDDRPHPNDFSYVWRGSPVEVMVDLANTIGADPWFTMPHMADDDYNLVFATMVKNTLDPDLVVHVEWSNEVWNFIFPQAVWARDQALERWGEGVPDDGWMQFAGLRAAQVADIWGEVYAEDEDQLVRIVGTHAGWFGLEESLLEAELVVADGLPRPVESFDGYAITGYFGFEIGEDDMAEVLHGWLDDGIAEQEVTRMLREGSFRELTDDVFPYHAQLTDRYGLELHMYEGGTHVAGHGEQSGDDRLTAFYNAYNYSADMAALYADLMAAWTENADGPFNAFVDVSAPSQFGSWGALRHLDDVNPRWATMQAFNAVPFDGGRAEDAFLHGITRIGTEAAEEFEGTPYDDVFIGWQGDDTFRPTGGTDRIHGGDGMDTVVLPGSEADYQQGWDGDTLFVVGDEGVFYLTAVETLVFDAAPDAPQSLILPDSEG